MKCFTHYDKDAVAVCKICLKGVCPSCAQTFSHGVSCPGTCADEMAKQAANIEVSAFVARGSRFIGGVFAPLALLGMAALLTYQSATSSRGFDGFAFLMIGVFLTLGLWLGSVSIVALLKQRAASNYSLKRTNQSLRD